MSRLEPEEVRQACLELSALSFFKRCLQRGQPGQQGLFHDASAYFSDEEWKLLHDWQKELYRNVMKEIHQALISLGPLIATTVCSLRAKENLHPLDDRDSKKKHRIQYALGDTMGDPDVHFRINNEESVHLNNPPRSEGRQQNEYLGTGFPFLNSDVCLSKEEPVAVSIDHIGSEMAESSRDTNSGFEVLSLRIKDEEDTYCMEHLERRRLKRVQNPAGDKSINSQKEARDSVKQTHPYKTSSEKINTMILQSSDKEANAGSQIWPESDRHLRGEKTVQHEISFSNSLHLSVHPRSPNRGRPDTYNECKSDLRNLQLPKDLAETQQTQRVYVCPKGEQSYTFKGEVSRHMIPSVRERPYACTECNKSFFQKSHLITHHRIHSGEKPYICIFCHKRFNRKDYLYEHTRIHTGETPYKCPKCEKSFIRKKDLNYHQRKHFLNMKNNI